MELTITGEVIEWRGPAPFHFLRLADDEAERIASVSQHVTYGWGMIPVECTIGATRFTTALWPRTGSYVVPLKDMVRTAEGFGLGDEITVRLRVQEPEERRRARPQRRAQ